MKISLTIVVVQLLSPVRHFVMLWIIYRYFFPLVVITLANGTRGKRFAPLARVITTRGKKYL